MKNRKSVIALSVALVFGVANLISYLHMPEFSTLDDGFVTFGWPFDIYARGGFAGGETILWTGLIGNVAVALCVIRLATKFLTKS
jgi:hypothetical protein